MCGDPRTLYLDRIANQPHRDDDSPGAAEGITYKEAYTRLRVLLSQVAIAEANVLPLRAPSEFASPAASNQYKERRKASQASLISAINSCGPLMLQIRNAVGDERSYEQCVEEVKALEHRQRKCPECNGEEEQDTCYYCGGSGLAV